MTPVPTADEGDPSETVKEETASQDVATKLSASASEANAAESVDQEAKAESSNKDDVKIDPAKADVNTQHATTATQRKESVHDFRNEDEPTEDMISNLKIPSFGSSSSEDMHELFSPPLSTVRTRPRNMTVVTAADSVLQNELVVLPPFQGDGVSRENELL